MRLLASTLFLTALTLIPAVQATSALTLSTFQPINGFDTACTNAYNTPLTDCSNFDFSGQGCSAKCIGFLDDLTKSLTEDCAGTSAYHTTLIGLFFANEGVQTLCSNAGGSSSSSGGANGNGQSGGQGGAYAAGQSAAGEASASSTSTSTSSTTSSSTTSTPQAAATTSTSSTPQAAATSSTTIDVATTVTPEPTTTSVAIVGTTVTPEPPSDASSSSSSTSPTQSSTSSSSTSTSTNSGNGGGTPLDTGSSACHDAAVSVWLFALLAGSASVAWLL